MRPIVLQIFYTWSEQELFLQQKSQEHLHSIKISENRPKIEIKKMNTNNIFERMQKEKEDEAERRLEEHR